MLPKIKNDNQFLDWVKNKDSSLKESRILASHYRVDNWLVVEKLRLTKIDFQYRHLSSTEFRNCVFEDCQLQDVVIMDCEFKECTFLNCHFEDSEFYNSLLFKCSFYNCNVFDTSLADCELHETSFNNCFEILDLALKSTSVSQLTFHVCSLVRFGIYPRNPEETCLIYFNDCVLNRCEFIDLDLQKSTFQDCTISSNVFANSKLSKETLINRNVTPGKEFNSIDIRTILTSDNQDHLVLEAHFGITHSEIKEYLFGLTTKLEYQSIFISYSFNDKKIAKKINDALSKNGIVCFMWENDAVAGKPLEHIMRSGISEKDRVLFIASKDSLKSEACHFELSEGRRKQEKTWESVLFPIHIDNFLFEVTKEQIRPLKVQDEYWLNIQELRAINSMDFSGSLDDSIFQTKIFELIKGLRRPR